MPIILELAVFSCSVSPFITCEPPENSLELIDLGFQTEVVYANVMPVIVFILTKAVPENEGTNHMHLCDGVSYDFRGLCIFETFKNASNCCSF